MKSSFREKRILKTMACKGLADRASGRFVRGVDIVLQCTAQSDGSVNVGHVNQ